MQKLCLQFSATSGLYDDSFMDEEEIPLGKPAIAAAFAAALAPHKLTPTKGHIVPDVSPVKATLEQAGTIIDAVSWVHEAACTVISCPCMKAEVDLVGLG